MENNFLSLEILEKCGQCKLCNVACPISRQTGRDSESPAGQIAILSRILRQNDQNLQKRFQLSSCLACGKCEEACPSQLPLTRIFLAAKILQEKWRESPLKQKAAFRLFHAPQLDSIKPVLKALATKNFQAIKKCRPLRLPKKPGEGQKPIALLFQGCIAKRLRPELARAAAASLKMAGYEVISPAGLACCGRAPGFTEKSLLATVRSNLKLLSRLDFEVVAALCPGCLHAIKNFWPNLPALSPKETAFAHNLEAKTHYLTSLLPELAPKEWPNAAWHSSCLLSEKNDAQARKAVGLANFPKNATCCGGVCEENSTRPASNEIFSRKSLSGREKLAKDCRDGLAAKHPEFVISTCPHCVLALEGIFRKRKDKIPLLHVSEYYAQIGAEMTDATMKVIPDQPCQEGS